MKLTLLAVTIAALTVTACGKPNQALPEQEKENFSKIMSQQQSAGQDQPAAGDTPSSAESPAADSGK
jgi:hypothetical protein